uniref:Uncharacterized protein n=1 Tax=Glycine max TaxID=3847 RepID=C6T4V7_SOYBN|nr:unknown [Glycine max]
MILRTQIGRRNKLIWMLGTILPLVKNRSFIINQCCVLYLVSRWSLLFGLGIFLSISPIDCNLSTTSTC